MKVKLTSMITLFTYLLLTLIQIHSGAYVGDQRQVLFCLGRGVDCTSVWEDVCCQGTLPQLGRSFQSMANLRFGSMFRDSIPPPRQYSPPTFQDIFGEKEEGRPDNNLNKEKPLPKVNLKLYNGITKVASAQQGKGLPQKYEGKLNMYQLQQLFNKKKLAKENSKMTETDRNAGKRQQSYHVTEAILSKLKRVEDDRSPGLHNATEGAKQRLKIEISTKLPPISEEDANDETISPSEPRPSSAGPLPVNPYSNSVGYGGFNELYQTRFTDASTTSTAATVTDYMGVQFLDMSGNTRIGEHLYRPVSVESLKQSAVPSEDFSESQYYAEPADDFQPVIHAVQSAEESSERVSSAEYEDDLQLAKDYPVIQDETNSVDNLEEEHFLSESGEKDIVDPPGLSSPQSHGVPPPPQEPGLLEVVQKHGLLPPPDHQEDADVAKNLLEPEHPAKMTSSKDDFSQELCEVLRVPCRFVTEHPCCKLPQGIGLVARPRAMDDSADLRWRYLETGLARGPQGRAISGLWDGKTRGGQTSFSGGLQDNSLIQYNFATSKDVVSVPEYHYDGGPAQTTVILGQCWRLTYLRCSEQTEHPCCALAPAEQTNRPADMLSNSLLDKWLVRV